MTNKAKKTTDNGHALFIRKSIEKRKKWFGILFDLDCFEKISQLIR